MKNNHFFCSLVIVIFTTIFFSCNSSKNRNEDENIAVDNDSGVIQDEDNPSTTDNDIKITNDSEKIDDITADFDNETEDADSIEEEPISCENNGEWKKKAGVVFECVNKVWVIRRITKTWGSSENDHGRSLAVDNFGNIFVTGNTAGALDGNDPLGWEFNTQDVFITKWNEDLIKEWTVLIGTEGNDYGEGIAVNDFTKVYVTGNMNDEGIDADGYPIDYADSPGSFLTMFYPSGKQVWIEYWGINEYDSGRAVAIDKTENIIVTGVVRNYEAMFTVGMFVLKRDSSGKELWAVEPGHGYPSSVAVDSLNNIYVSGGAHNSGNEGNFLMKFDDSGNIIWKNTWGKSEYSEAFSVAVDSFDNIYTVDDIDLTKWDSDGNLLWNKNWGSAGIYGAAFSITINENDNIYITGSTDTDLDGNINSGKGDVFLSKWNTEGKKIWTQVWGTAEDEYGLSVAVDKSNAVYVSGYTEGALDNCKHNGKADIFLSLVFDSDDLPEIPENDYPDETNTDDDSYLDDADSIEISDNDAV